MRYALLTLIAACGSSGSDGLDAIEHDAGPLSARACADFNNQPGYVRRVPEASCVFATNGINWVMRDPFGVGALPMIAASYCAEPDCGGVTGPVGKIDATTWTHPAIQWDQDGGENGVAVIVEPADDKRCQWVRCVGLQ